MVSGIAVRMEITLISCKEFLGMLRSATGLVFIQNDRPVCISSGPVQPHIAFTFWFLSRFMEYLQRGLICMEDVSPEKFLMQPLVYRSQVLLCCFQNPVGHGLPAQADPLSVHLLFLPVQRRAHYELLRHDMGDSLRRGKAAGNHVFLPGSLCNGRFAAFVGIFAAVPAGVGIVDILADNGLGRDDLQSADHFLTDLGHGLTALGAYQFLTLQAVLRLFNGDPLRNGVQRIFVFLVPPVSRYSGNILRFFFPGGRINLCFIKQETQLLCESVFTLLGGCAEPLVPGQTQGFHEHLHMTFKLRDFLSLSLELFIFRAGNGDCSGAVCINNFCLFHVNIIPHCC